MDHMLGQLDHSKILVCSHFQLLVTYNNSSYAWSMLQIYVKLITNFKLSNNQILQTIKKGLSSACSSIGKILSTNHSHDDFFNQSRSNFIVLQ